MTHDNYILKDKKVVKTDLMTWAKWFETNNRIVKQEILKNGKFISTVFLGMDYNFGEGAPLVFETMVFPKKGVWGELDIERYSTWDEAVKGHNAMVKKWK